MIRYKSFISLLIASLLSSSCMMLPIDLPALPRHMDCEYDIDKEIYNIDSNCEQFIREYVTIRNQ